MIHDKGSQPLQEVVPKPGPPCEEEVEGVASGTARRRAISSSRRRSRARSNAAMKLLRRAHMYSGLFLAPWVLLYGVTAFLFNHPEVFPDREVRHATRSDLAGTRLEGFPTAPELARQIVEALNARTRPATFRLLDADRAAYTRAITATVSAAGREHSVRLDPESGGAVIRSTTAAVERPSRWPTTTDLPLPDPPRERLARGIPNLLGRVGLRGGPVTVRNPPDLVCTVEADGRPWRLAYNVQTGAISARDPGAGLSNRRFLTGLHLAFGYSSSPDARWAWAVIVDAMSLAMAFWGLSGLLMWWQMRSLRRAGSLVLVASVAVAAAVAFGMHGVLAR